MIAFCAALGVFAADVDCASMRGVVTLMRGVDDYFFLRTDYGEDWRIALEGGANAPRFARGDVVKVDGELEPRPNRHTRRIFHAKATKESHDETRLPSFEGTSIAELTQKPREALFPDWYAKPVSIVAKVHDFWRRDTLLTIVLFDSDEFIYCQVSTAVNVPFPEYFGIGANVRVEGIAVCSAVWGEGRKLAGFDNVSILSNGMSSIEVVSKPPWWTPKKIWMVAGGAVSISFVLAVWIILLTRAIRAERANERLLAEERRRIASDLHDTIEQHLAGVKILVEAAVKVAGDSSPCASILDKAARMLMHAKKEVRVAVMDLRGSEDDLEPLDVRLRSLAREVEGVGDVKVRLALRQTGTDLGAGEKNDLILIAREAIANALKHGRAKNIAIVCDPADGAFVLRILNDGEPFDAAAAPGAAQGHFGLDGMRRRANKHGWNVSFGTEGRWTVVAIAVQGKLPGKEKW